MTDKIRVEAVNLCSDLPLPGYMSHQAAGLDLLAAVDQAVEISPGKTGLIPTGLMLGIPSGYEGQVRPRSGLALKHGITCLNSPGTIDADYRGEIKVILINLGEEAFLIRRGDRIAQLVFNKIAQASLIEVEELPETGRGSGGFGSTGTSA